MNKLMALWKDEQGATAVEYGIMVALIAALIVTVVATLGKQVNEGFTNVSDSLTSEGITGAAPAPE